jgi:hypothetical protein
VTRLQGFVLVIFIVALSISVIFGSPRYVFAVTALVIFGFVLIGFLVLPKLECALPYSAPPSDGERVMIGGIETSSADFGTHFTCTFHLAGWDKLGRWLLISVVAFCFAGQNTRCGRSVRAISHLQHLHGFHAGNAGNQRCDFLV